MAKNTQYLIKEMTQIFFFQEKMSYSEQNYIQELLPHGQEVELSFEEQLELFNEVASFYTGEFARLIKRFLLTNDLFAKDNARIIKEELFFFRKFFHFILSELDRWNIQKINQNRLHYVILKIDTYLKKYASYLNL